MTDQAIPADLSPADVAAAREWAKTIAAANRVAYTDPARAAARAVLAAYPTPPLPTLADMTEEERAACQRMQADVKGYTPAVILRVGVMSAHLMGKTGAPFPANHEDVTPRPDLPRWEWPGTEKPAPVPALPGGWLLADHPKHGRVIVTTPEPDPNGHVYYVLPDDDDHMGYDWHFCTPDELTYIDQEADQ